MRKLLLLLSFILMQQVLLAQSLQSPEQFMGYKIGTRYTPHHRIVDYYRHVAAAVPNIVKLQQYGQTNEGRP